MIAESKSGGRASNGRGNAGKTRVARRSSVIKVTTKTEPVSKEELRAKIEKLERANAVLRIKNKELRVVAAQAAEQVDSLTLQLTNRERRAGRQTRHEGPTETLKTREPVGPSRSKRKAHGVATRVDNHDDQEPDAEMNTAA